MEQEKLNAHTIEKELQWLSQIIDYRFDSYFDREPQFNSIFSISPPDLSDENSKYAELIKTLKLGLPERLVLILALTPHVRPQLLDPFFIQKTDLNRGFTEFGGIKGGNHGGFIPTGETAAFLFAGIDIQMRMEIIRIFDSDHTFHEMKIAFLNSTKENEPFLSGPLSISPDYIDILTLGKAKKPTFSSKFPAIRIETKLAWEDLILDRQSRKEIDHMLTWVKNHELIMNEWGMKGKIKPGYRALFHGPPGTGKTLTASLLGKAAERDVYRIDISMISSKWVGETEKNLARIFDTAETKDWILFFDEADSIFGKRTSTGSSQEKHSNQEVSYLLQRTEEYPGIVILASNLKGNIDDAFIRRFQSMVYFKMPDVDERLKLWTSAFDGKLTLSEDVDIKKIAKEHEISGGSIANVLKYCSIGAIQQDTRFVTSQILLDGIRNEMAKEGKVV